MIHAAWTNLRCFAGPNCHSASQMLIFVGDLQISRFLRLIRYVSWVIHCSLVCSIPIFSAWNLHRAPRRFRLVSGKGHGGFTAKRHSRDASKERRWSHRETVIFPGKHGPYWWSMTWNSRKIRIWKHGEHGDLVWHFPQRCDESISFWTCPWYVFTFLIAHSISHIRWQWISMDALIHVFPGLFHSCGVYSQVFSIATPAYFLAKLTLPLGKLSILCGFTPFFWVQRWTPHFNWWHPNFSWWNPQFLGISPHYRACGGASWKSNGQNSAWWENRPETYWENHGETGWVRYIYIYIFFQHSVFFSSHHMGWSENWATPQDHASTANHHVSPKHRYVVAIISPIPSPLHGLQHSAADGIPPNVLAALPWTLGNAFGSIHQGGEMSKLNTSAPVSKNLQKNILRWSLNSPRWLHLLNPNKIFQFGKAHHNIQILGSLL